MSRLILLFLFISTSVFAQPSEIACLTTNIYYEGRGETLEGMRAIGSVVINRMKHPSFKGQDSLCKVTFAKGQFSWYKPKSKPIQKLLNGDTGGLKDKDKEAYQKAEEAESPCGCQEMTLARKRRLHAAFKRRGAVPRLQRGSRQHHRR